MRLRHRVLHTLAFLALLPAVSMAWAVSPEMQEFIALQKARAPEKCRQARDYTEMMIVGNFAGGAARMEEIEKRSREPRTPEREAQAKRMNELGKMKPTPEDSQALMESAGRWEAFCPYGKEGVPVEPLPPIKDTAMARDAVLAYVPRTLMKLRQCEVFFPERRGAVEKAWANSAFSKLAMPELQAPVNEVRGWLKEDLGAPLPGSRLERQMKDAHTKNMQMAECDRTERDLARVEAAMPSGFLKK
ncbi:hypothetical protein BWI17_02485 [Betaproteobacteria bacterium GR16-43]|nr:hypothetical protein BWI17_02485 [Betaproteobacteria bacterium GR16-43]